MGETLTVEVRNTHDAIAPASAMAEEWLERHGADPRSMYLVMLAIEELVTNCIKYGYDDSAEHTILILLALDPETLSMTVVDDGHPFDPLAAPPPDLTPEVEERQIGGLGLHLLRQMADDITYERRDGTNRMTLTKRRK